MLLNERKRRLVVLNNARIWLFVLHVGERNVAPLTIHKVILKRGIVWLAHLVLYS